MKNQKGVAIFIAILIVVTVSTLLVALSSKYIYWNEKHAFSKDVIQSKWISDSAIEWAKYILSIEKSLSGQKADIDDLNSLWNKSLSKTSLSSFLDIKQSDSIIENSFIDADIKDINRYFNWEAMYMYKDEHIGDAYFMDDPHRDAKYSKAVYNTLKNLNISQYEDKIKTWKYVYNNYPKDMRCEYFKTFWSDEEWEQSNKYIKCVPVAALINLNTMDIQLAKYMFSNEIADKIIKERKIKSFQHYDDLIERIPEIISFWDSQTYSFSSSLFELKIGVTIKDIRREKKVFLRRNSNKVYIF